PEPAPPGGTSTSSSAEQQEHSFIEPAGVPVRTRGGCSYRGTTFGRGAFIESDRGAWARRSQETCSPGVWRTRATPPSTTHRITSPDVCPVSAPPYPRHTDPSSRQ